LPPAKYRHNQIAKRMFLLILETVPLKRVDLLDCHQMPPHNWLVPDVGVKWPDQAVVNDYTQGAPMIAIEVASPGNTAKHIADKVRVYLRYGAAEIWVIYPKTRLMKVHTATPVEEVTDTYPCHVVPVTVRLSDILADAD
jgi:Uma2 family endonuclease